MRKTNFPPRSKVHSNPRDLTPEDRESWYDAASQRPEANERTIENLKLLIRNRNPVRWWRIRNDYKWLQREMLRLGMSPEDARFLL